MRDGQWNWNTGVKVAAAAVVFAMVLAPILEMARPGSVMCPLRRLAKKADLPVGELSWDMLEEISPVDMEQARNIAAGWKEQALAAYPNLRVEAQPVPLEENGFWQLIQLESAAERPMADFSEMLREINTLDMQHARDELAASDAWLQLIERIAKLPQSSNMALPDPKPWLPVSDIRQANDALLLKSLLAARDKNEAEALRWMRLSGDLCTHFRKIETPTLLSETCIILFQRTRIRMITEQVLPALGPYTNLAPWRDEIIRFDYTPATLAKATRGEWHATCDSMMYPFIAVSHQQRMLVDPDEVAMTHAAITSLRIQQLENTPSFAQLTSWTNPPSIEHLSPEGREILHDVGTDLSLWLDGYKLSGRIAALHQAAIELLMKEPCMGELEATNAEDVTCDPETGEPFEFDAEARTLCLPGESYDPKDEAKTQLKLSW